MKGIAIAARGLSKLYHIGRAPGRRRRNLRALWEPLRQLASSHDADEAGDDSIWSLRDVSFEVPRGQVLGVIGRNGAGKSTLLKILSRITEPTRGRAEIRGRIGSLLEVGTGFHPELSGRENIYLNGAILGMRRPEIRRKFDEIVAFAEVERFIDTPVKHYSSGMSVRLAFAVAAHLEAEILLVDEVLAVGDMGFQRKCLGKLGDVVGAGRTVLFVSHNMTAIGGRCSEVMLLEGGCIVYKGEVAEGIRSYVERAGSDAPDEGTDAQIARLPPDASFELYSFDVAQEGSDGSIFVTTRPIAVRISYAVKQATHGLRVGFDVKQQASAYVVFRSFHDDAPDAALDSAAGRHVASATIPADLLSADRYRLELIVAVSGLRWIVSGEVHRSVEVVNVDGLSSHYSDVRPGFVLPRIDWRVEREP